MVRVMVVGGIDLLMQSASQNTDQSAIGALLTQPPHSSDFQYRPRSERPSFKN